MQNDNCTAALSSLTYAMKAQKELSTQGFYTNIVKLDSSRTRRGCAYGIQFSCADTEKIRKALKNAKIGVSQYISGGGDLL